MFQCGHGRIQNHGQQDAQQYINAAVLLEQDRGRCLLYTSPILPDIGMFASFDPVALDQACADACLNAQPLPNSQLGQNLAKPGWNCHHDNFKDSNPNVEWKATLDQAEKIGMGTRQYTLKKI